jgi:hypothetical protein
MRADTTMNGRNGKSRTILWKERRKRGGKESEVGRENGRFNIEGEYGFHGTRTNTS